MVVRIRQPHRTLGTGRDLIVKRQNLQVIQRYVALAQVEETCVGDLAIDLHERYQVLVFHLARSVQVDVVLEQSGHEERHARS